MELVRPASLADFIDLASPFLLEHEAEHGLMLGVAMSADRSAPPLYCGVVADNDGVVAAALRTNTRLIVSREGTNGAMKLIAADSVHPECNAVLGPVDSVAAFVDSSELRWNRGMAQGIYENRNVTDAPIVQGRFRQAEPSDSDLLAHWSQRLHREALAEDVSLKTTTARIAAHIGRGSMHVWEVDGLPVSMAAAVAPTPHGIRLNNVYTPPEERRRGYASALVAALTRLLLDRGCQFVFLHTDLANPTSNAIYQRLGYVLVADLQVYSLVN